MESCRVTSDARHSRLTPVRLEVKYCYTTTNKLGDQLGRLLVEAAVCLFKTLIVLLKHTYCFIKAAFTYTVRFQLKFSALLKDYDLKYAENSKKNLT